MTIPSQMRAVKMGEGRGASSLSIEEIDVPSYSANEVLIKVAASGINRPDIIQRDGFYPAPPGHSKILGLEVSGEIVAVGDRLTELKIGDKIAALTNGGGYAEYCTASHGSVLPIPGGLSVDEAASLPETYFTVWHNVFERGALKPGEWLLVHGGSSGIGVAAIQFAKAFNAKVMITAGSKEKCDACIALGADAAINYREEDFAERARQITEGRGVDVILDMVGGDYIQKNIDIAAPDGRIVQIAFLQGAKAEVNFMKLMMKRLLLTGSTLRARSDEFKASVARELKQEIWPLVEAGKIKPIIAQTFAFEDVIKAHELMESSQHIGNIILKFDD